LRGHQLHAAWHGLQAAAGLSGISQGHTLGAQGTQHGEEIGHIEAANHGGVHHGAGHDVGQIIFALCIVIGQRGQPGTQAGDAVIDAEHGPPVAMHHVFKVLHRLGAVIRELFPPFKQRPVNAVPGVKTLFDPGRLVFQLEGNGWIRNPHIIKGMFILRLRRVEAVRRLMPHERAPGLLPALLL